MVKEDIILSSDVDVGADGVGAWSATGSAPYRVSSLPLNKFQSYEVYTSYRGQNLGSCQGQPTKKVERNRRNRIDSVTVRLGSINHIDKQSVTVMLMKICSWWHLLNVGARSECKTIADFGDKKAKTVTHIL